MIYADFGSILVPEDNGKQNQNECYIKKYQKHVVWSCSYKLVCVDDIFTKPFKSYWREDSVYNFINNMTEEVRIIARWWKNISTTNVWWLKRAMKILRTVLNAESMTMIMSVIMLK